MEKLVFERRKYGKELLIDACNQDEMVIQADTMLLSFYTIIFIKEGHGTFYLDTEAIELDNHTVIFIRPGQINKLHASVLEKCHLLFFEGDFLDEFFNDINFIYKFGFFHNPQLPSSLRLKATPFEKYYAIVSEIREEIHALSRDSKHILRSLVYYLLVKMHQEYGKHYDVGSYILTDPYVLAFLKLLENGLDAQQNVGRYAEMLGVSRSQLNNLCQKYFAKSAGQIIKERLVAEIKKELKYSAANVSEIAYQFDFSAPSHFSRFVKQMTGMSPQEFRDSMSNW